MTPRHTRPTAEIALLLSQSSGTRLQRLLDEHADDERASVQALIMQARNRIAAEKAESRRVAGLYRLEKSLVAEGYRIVAGVDEVGRGALAGPLTACACVLPATPRVLGLDDSKRLTPERRAEIARVVRQIAVCWSIGHVEAAEIDAIGMTSALRRAMGRALAGLDPQAEHVVVDGHPVGVSEAETAVIKGDSKVACIAAASILAKVERDAIMVGYADSYPEYGFDVHKGYGTPTHLEAIARLGLSPLHRASFSIGGGTGRLF